jgi:glycosyltransferase involved in cell wall biosynthesis
VRRIRVLEMIDRPTLGGGQKAVLLLAGGLDRSVFDVAVSSESGGPIVEELGRIGVAHHPARFGRSRWRANIRDLRSILRAESVDVLHTHGGKAGFFGRWAAWQARTPVVVHTLHGIHYLHYRNPVLRRVYIRLERDFSRFTDRLILVSEADREAARKLRPSPETAARFRAGRGWSGTGPLVGTIARLHRQKGVVYLIRAAARIRSVHPGLRLVCAGGGPMEAELRREVRALNLESSVVLMGETGEAMKLLAASDVFVLPSLWEGLPFALIEAAALGRPIVATDVAGNREVITDGETGLLVPPADPEALAGAVVRLLGDGALAGRLAESARRLIPPRFTLGRMIRQTEELYRQAWTEKHPAGSPPPGALGPGDQG